MFVDKCKCTSDSHLLNNTELQGEIYIHTHTYKQKAGRNNKSFSHYTDDYKEVEQYSTVPNLRGVQIVGGWKNL